MNLESDFSGKKEHCELGPDFSPVLGLEMLTSTKYISQLELEKLLHRKINVCSAMQS